MRVGLHAIAVALVCVRGEARASGPASPADQQLALAGAGRRQDPGARNGMGPRRPAGPARRRVESRRRTPRRCNCSPMASNRPSPSRATAIAGSAPTKPSSSTASGRDDAVDRHPHVLAARRAPTAQRVVGPDGRRPGAPAPDSFVHGEALVARNIYLAAIRNGDLSNFYGAAVSTTPVTVALTVRNPAPGAADAAILSVALQGVTATAHVVDVALNGVGLGLLRAGRTRTRDLRVSRPPGWWRARTA